MAAPIHELTLSKLIHGGDALGRLDDGRAAFVRFGLPGERVRVELVEARGHFARARIIEVLQPAPERIAPRCKHFGPCGGCQYQHMSYESQVAAKAEILRDQLVRIGRFVDPPVQPVVASPNPWNYRNHVQFHVTEKGRLGFVRDAAQTDAPAEVFALEECHLPEPSINELWPRLELEGSSGIERVSIRAGTDDELMLVLESDSPIGPEMEIEAGISAVHMVDGECIVMAGEDHVMHRVLDREFRVSAPAFFQVNTPIAEKMVEHVLERLPRSIGTLIDAYCGVGLFTAFLAGRCERVIGIESAAAACRDFAVNLDEFSNVELYEDSVERALPALGARPDILLIDPPRAGVAREALDAMVKMAPDRLIYVSCDAATLARDAHRLTDAGYRLLEVTPFDLFPQTSHIESIGILER